MRLQTACGAVVPGVLEACAVSGARARAVVAFPSRIAQRILDEEARAYDECVSRMQSVSQRELVEARDYMNRVVCDECSADIFNGHVVHGTDTFCMGSCAEAARARGLELRLCMPVPLVGLRTDLAAAKSVMKA